MVAVPAFECAHGEVVGLGVKVVVLDQDRHSVQTVDEAVPRQAERAWVGNASSVHSAGKALSPHSEASDGEGDCLAYEVASFASASSVPCVAVVLPQIGAERVLRNEVALVVAAAKVVVSIVPPID